MPNFRAIDMLVIDDLFKMEGGFVLNFSNRTFAQFFAGELNVDICDPIYCKYGTSKANRLRYFLQSVDRDLAARTLTALWEYREALRLRAGQEENIKNAERQLQTIIKRLNSDGENSNGEQAKAAPTFDHAKYQHHLTELQNLSALEPHPRGYAFEKFLKTLFSEFGLQARDPFQLRGEQIDGSFVLGNETYLLEAKWQNSLSGVSDLHTFHGKVEQKAAWARGLFISFCGFSEEGLYAFGRGKRVICMDGLDLSETLERELPLVNVLEHKIRRAAETGSPFTRVRDLFPA